MRRMILIPIITVVILLAISGGVGYFVYNNYMYYSTDDAQITGPIVSVSAPGSGQLKTLTAQTGEAVTAGEHIGTVSTSTQITSVDGTVSTKTSTLNLVSPISGTIVQVAAVQGQSVTPGLTVFQVANLNALTVTAYVDESAINNIKTGQSVDIKVDAYSGTAITGHVQQIIQATADTFSLLPSQDNASGNFSKVSQRIPVIITLDDNAGKDLMPGLSSEVTIHIH
ncbi:MAG TPA: HlyD family efflux transporter periplasmic adaptor subunit [Ktedonobacteraceae bacterium]